MRQYNIDNKLTNLRSKHLSYIDKKTGDYIKLNCEFTATISELREFFGTIERMKLDSSIMGSNILKKDNTTRNLVKKYREILINDEIIDFTEIINLYEKDVRNSSVVLTPIIKFLNMFDISTEKTFDSYDIYLSLTKSRNPLFGASLEEIKSLEANTEILNTPIIKFSEMNQQEISKHKTKVIKNKALAIS